MPSHKINEAAQRQIRQFFRQLVMMFVAFLASIFLFMLSAILFVEMGERKEHDLDTVLLIIAPITGLGMLLIAQRLFLGRINPLKGEHKLHEKMEAYRSGYMLRFLLFDGAAFIQIISFFLTENRLFLALTVAVSTMFLLYRPGLERFIKEMELNSVESQVMRDHAAKP